MYSPEGPSGTDATVTGVLWRVLTTSTVERGRANATAEGGDSRPSDAAQQLSACACVMARPARALPSPAPCMGQEPPSEQHDMRASAVAAQPAHSAHPDSPRVRATARAAARLNSGATGLGCLIRSAVSTNRGKGR